MNHMVDRRTLRATCLLVLAIFVVSTAVLAAGPWQVMGPDGGDARSLAYDFQNPDHIFLGTSTGQMFTSNDGGHVWTRLAHLGGDDYVLDHIIVDPRDANHVYVSAWSSSSQQMGEVFATRDGGHTWQTLPAMHGKSIRALAMYRGDASVLVAGALDGVYRTNDGGLSWQRMSPAGTDQIKNIESIAVDPNDANTVYAGTWHLAWKTSDAGANWEHINKGMIDDSDVFSVIVDHDNSHVVFASACSGIYKSESAGEQFSKIQGIPFTARRTRVLKQDPTNENIVYAGTTEGFWKSMDLGKSWKRVTNPEVVVNDVYVDPRDSNHVLIATDRSGVMATANGGVSWETSNHGYAHRYVSALLTDNQSSNTLYVGIVNDREYGGVFYSRDNGQHWMQKASGLDGRDVFVLKQTSNGTLVAGTNRGIFSLEHNSSQWHPMNEIVSTATRTIARKGSKKTTKTTTTTRHVLEARVNDLELDPHRWLAATAAGIFTSTDVGKTWHGGLVLGQQDFVSIRAQGDTILAATRSSAIVSSDAGATWIKAGLPNFVVGIRGTAIAADNQLLLAAREGAFRSEDGGATWQHVLSGLPANDITSISFDTTHNRLLVTSDQTGIIFESRDGGRTFQRGPDSGYPLRRVSVMGERYIGATPFDGVIVQPENESISAATMTSSN